jgi:hypothetical protein
MRAPWQGRTVLSKEFRSGQRGPALLIVDLRIEQAAHLRG